MNTPPSSATSWRQLQTELRDLAFLLDRQGSHAAAELAVNLAAGFDDLIPALGGAVESRQHETP